jgi:hypothetical protein
MSAEGYGFFDLVDIPMPDDPRSPIAKTFEDSDPFSPESDTESEFAKAHSAENMAAMYTESWTHRPCRQPLAKTFEKRATLQRDYFARQMRSWIEKGESIHSYIHGCHPSIRAEVARIAREEGLL